MGFRRTIAYLVALSGFVLELFCYTQGGTTFGVLNAPVWWLVGGLMTAGGLFWANQLNTNPTQYAARNVRYFRYLLTFVMLVVLCWVWQQHLPAIIADNPIDPLRSDVLPSFKLYATRWLSGDWVYAPLTFPGWTVYPTYLPAMWWPYVIAELGKFDYRYLPAILFGIFVVWQALQLAKSNTAWWVLVVELALFPWLISQCLHFRRDDFGMALEFTPATFYLVLGWVMLRPNPFSIGVAVSLCLLSRYSVSFWLPAMLLIWWIDSGFKKPFIAGLTAVAMVVVLYILPYYIKDPSALSKGIANYDVAAYGQWNMQSFQAASDVYPYHLAQGLSFSLWFRENGGGTVTENYNLLKYTHLAMCVGVALLLVLVFWWKRRRIGSWNLYALAGLKLYLTVFYAFLYAPFSYLYQVPLLLSFVILAAIRR